MTVFPINFAYIVLIVICVLIKLFRVTYVNEHSYFYCDTTEYDLSCNSVNKCCYYMINDVGKLDVCKSHVLKFATLDLICQQ